MCDNCQNGCQRPDELMGKPEDCSPAQIRTCHGDGKDHPCAPEKKEK